MHIRKYIVYHNKGHTLKQFSSHYYLQMNLPCLIEITRESIFHNLQHISLWPTELTLTCVLTNRNWFLNLIQQILPCPPPYLPPSLPPHGTMGVVGCVRPVLINRPSSLVEMDVQFIVEQERENTRKIKVSRGQDRWNRLDLHLEQVPKVNLESQGKKPPQNHKNPKQYTPFCLGYRTGVLGSGLSADVELRERKGGWLVRNWSLAAVSRVLAMASTMLVTTVSWSWQWKLWQGGRLSAKRFEP